MDFGLESDRPALRFHMERQHGADMPDADVDLVTAHRKAHTEGRAGHQHLSKAWLDRAADEDLTVGEALERYGSN